MIELAGVADPAIGWALGLGCLFGGLLLFAHSLRSSVFHLRSARSAHALETSPPPLAPGPITVRGTVVRDGRGPVFELRIRQHGEDYRGRNGANAHTWAEVDRTRAVRPFWLDLPIGGHRIWVEPHPDVVFMGELVPAPRNARTPREARTCVAQLVAGDSVSITGELSRGPVPGEGSSEGYRDGLTGWVLKSPAGALWSPQDLARHGRRWAPFHLLWVWGAVLFVALSQGALYAHFYDVALNGVVCRGEIVALASHGSPRVGNEYYVVHGETDEDCPAPGAVVEGPVSAASFDTLSEGQIVDWLVVPERRTHHVLGTTPVLDLRVLFGVVLLLVATAVGYYFHWRSLRSWWDQRKVTQHGRGPL